MVEKILDQVDIEKLRSVSEATYVAGDYPWDRWQKIAIELGVSERLSWAGRQLMREWYQHMWPEELRTECGWEDNGVGMVTLAMTNPEFALARWLLLYESDAGRAPDVFWADARQLWRDTVGTPVPGFDEPDMDDDEGPEPSLFAWSYASAGRRRIRTLGVRQERRHRPVFIMPRYLRRLCDGTYRGSNFSPKWVKKIDAAIAKRALRGSSETNVIDLRYSCRYPRISRWFKIRW
ncbi:hypothetical protein [Magnetospirillum molischianum]|uniref:Uncharacterized protein n=1 Tax=Magnetospirillum molischianum DSM 120 TaxID=1150626 RepID=H8FY22_MAGML|nr:hypothetical protein [Magnetospirillum molischianum]CCG43260.1 hypothetical protein PHAMO_80051 [Magnetospirillum molischianum DSM 120]